MQWGKPQQRNSFSFWRKALLLYSDGWCLQTSTVPALNEARAGLLWQPLAKNTEVTSHSQHRDRQLSGRAAQPPSIFSEVVWGGVTTSRDDFTYPACLRSSFFFFLARSRHLRKGGVTTGKAETSPCLSDRLWVTAGSWRAESEERGCPCKRVGGFVCLHNAQPLSENVSQKEKKQSPQSNQVMRDTAL